MLTSKQLHECLDYDSATGVFRWIVTRGRAVEGAIAGSPHKDGYNQIKIDRKLYKAHRLAWLYVYGTWPPARLDHINNCGSDNRIDNLRLATHSQNMANRKTNKNSTSGYKGVSFRKSCGKYCAYVNCLGKRRYLGYNFKTPEAAHAAYVLAATELHGEFARAA